MGRILFFIITLRKMLKSRYGGSEFKELRKNVWKTLWFMLWYSPVRWVESLFMWWIAILWSKKIRESLYRTFRLNGHWLSIAGNKNREIMLIESAMQLRTQYAEEIHDNESAMGYINWRYEFANFTEIEKDYIREWLNIYDFDKFCRDLKMNLSKWQYYLYMHLDFEQTVRPLVPDWYLPTKSYWYRAWMFWAMRNPKSNETHVHPRFRSSNMRLQEIIGFDNTDGVKVGLEGIGGQTIGEMFWFTADQKYFSYQCTTKDGSQLLMFGYGVKPNYFTSRGRLEMKARKIPKNGELKT